MTPSFSAKIENVSTKCMSAIAKQIIAMDEGYYLSIHTNFDLVIKCVMQILSDPQSDLGQLKVLMQGDEVAAFYIAYAMREKLLRVTTSLKIIKNYLKDDIPQFENFVVASRQFSSNLPAVANEGYYLNKIGVVPNFQGIGLGRLALNAYLDDCDGHSLSALLHVQRNNKIAIELYSKAGFIFKDSGVSYIYAERQS